MRRIVGLVMAFVVIAGPAAARPGADGAKRFLQTLLDPYQGTSAQPVTLADPGRYYEARLAQAIVAEAAAANRRGEAPALNGDPICDCQDYIPFRAAIGPVRLRGNRAEATVRFDNGRPRVLRFSLVATRQGWRIRDIDSGDSSLRALYKLPR